MNLRVIQGGLRDQQLLDAATPLRTSPFDVRREADRRLHALDYDRYLTRERAVGIAVPREIRYLAMQIDFVARTLSSLADIPEDFRSDRYWPA